MLDTTYEVFAAKRRGIKRRIDELKRRDSLKKYAEHWRGLELKPLKRVIGAEDGSANHKKYKSIVFYAANALALIYDDGLEEYKCSDIDILYPYRDVENRLAIYRSILELKASLQALDKVDLFLIDGSIFTDLVTSRGVDKGLRQEDVKEVVELLPELEAAEGATIASKELACELNGNSMDKIVFLEYLEYLSCLQKLLEKGHDKLVGISKTSTRAEFNEGIPDMAIFEEITMDAGYSKPTSDLFPIWKKFPIYHEFFKNFVFTTCYARLEDRKGVLLVEFPREITEGEVEEALRAIGSTSVMGYPYLLRKAHREAVITNREMQKLALSLGIVEKTGREVLG
ncbi:MAG: DNA double-strand break repair nuclease NurA [Candidatus Hydrothermarchaeota archaeon]|nr:DNA double-strand break repair nuclease NurA [Candidatus Hydrothermarchaeota archaeon]